MEEPIPMFCVCNKRLPLDAPLFPIKPQGVSKINDRGVKQTIRCTAIIRCHDKIHTPTTGWNYLEWAIERGKE